MFVEIRVKSKQNVPNHFNIIQVIFSKKKKNPLLVLCPEKLNWEWEKF